MAEGLQPPSNDELWREVDELKSRVASLEAARNEATTPPNSKSIDIAPQPLATPAGLHQAIPSSRSRQGDPSPLEAKIGAQLFNRVGVFAVLAGAAWFLKLAMDRAWIGPGIRVAVGLVVAVLLVVWSERFRHTGATVFSNTLKALGSGIAYLSLWAAVNLYQLFQSSPGGRTPNCSPLSRWAEQSPHPPCLPMAEIGSCFSFLTYCLSMWASSC